MNKLVFKPQDRLSIDFAESERQKTKNLFNENIYLSYYCTYANGVWTTQDTSGGFNLSIFTNQVGYKDDRDVSKLPFFKKGTYTITFYNATDNTSYTSDAITFASYNSNGTIISNLTSLGIKNGIADSKTFTLNEDSYLDIRRQNNTGTISFNHIQIEEGTVATDYQEYIGVIVHEKDIEDVEHIKTLYDMSNNSSDINWGYRSGISSTNVDDETLANGKVLITHPYIDLTKYKGVKVYMIAGNETFVAEGYNYVYNTYRGGGGGYAHSWNYSQSAEFDFYMGSTEFLFRPRLRTASGELKVLNNQYCYIYKIEGVL